MTKQPHVCILTSQYFDWGIYGGFGSMSRKLAESLVGIGYRVSVHGNDARVAARATCERLHGGYEIELRQYFRELPLRFDVSDPVPVPDNASLEETDIACERDPTIACRHICHLRILLQQQRIESGESKKGRELPKMHIEHEAHRMRRIRAGTPHACKIDGAERRIHGDVVASVDSDREVFRCAVDYDEIDFRMRNPEPFNHVLHGRPAAHGVMEAVAPAA